MKNRLYILLIFFFAFNLNVRSQEYIDSLKTLVSQTNDPNKQFGYYFGIVGKLATDGSEETNKYFLLAKSLSEKINTPEVKIKLEFLNAIVVTKSDDYLKAKVLFEKVIPKLEKNKMKLELGNAYGYLGEIKIATSDYIGAIEQFEKSIVIATELNDLGQLAESHMYMGRCFQGMGNIPKALECYQKALGPAQQVKRSRLTTQINLFIGALYSEGVNAELGLKYLTKAGEIAVQMRDTSMIMSSYTYIANQYYYRKEYDKALEKYQQILVFNPKHGSPNTYAGVLGNMGNVYADMGQIEKGMDLQFQALKIFEEIGDKQGATICLSAIGIDYLNLKQYDKAKEYFDKSLPMAQEMQSLEDLIEIHFSLSRLYEETKDYEKAYFNFKLYKKFNDSVYNGNNAQKITEMELNYQFESREKEAKLLQEITNERFKRTVFAAVSVGLILLIIVFLIGRANRQRKRANQQLTLSNNAIRLQKEELETHKKEITDSINYAKRIQESILPPETYWKNCLPDSFIFYRPKDIVSGDFYWIEQKDDTVCFAAVDCTGHGVPGALMSVVGFNLLTQAVNEMNLTIPSEILKHLDHGVTKTLRQSEDGKGVKDGMDLSLCSLNLKTNELQYAGAYNSLYYVDNGIFKEVKSDKFPIGVNIDGKVDNYTNHSFQLKKGDCVYLFSDGYADQFGGIKGKKFKYNQLKELLHKNYLLPIEEQKAELAKAFDSWKGDLEQVDDVVIIGVRV